MEFLVVFLIIISCGDATVQPNGFQHEILGRLSLLEKRKEHCENLEKTVSELTSVVNTLTNELQKMKDQFDHCPCGSKPVEGKGDNPHTLYSSVYSNRTEHRTNAHDSLHENDVQSSREIMKVRRGKYIGNFVHLHD